MINLQGIKRYEKNYYNCRLAQVISLFKWQGIQVESLFYNTFEKTNEVFEQTVNKGFPRWEYKVKSFSEEEISILGIKIVQIPYQDFLEVEEPIKNLSETKTVSLLFGNSYYLPHSQNFEKEHRAGHSLMLLGYTNETSRCYYIMDEDWVTKAGEYSFFCYDQSILRNSCNTSKYKFIQYFDFSLYNEEVAQTVIDDRFRSWQGSFHDELYAYVQCIDLLSQHSAEELSQMKSLGRIATFCRIIAGSRFVFARYIQYRGISKELAAQLLETSRFAELTSFLLIKYDIKKDLVTRDRIVLRLTALMEYERKNVQMILDAKNL